MRRILALSTAAGEPLGSRQIAGVGRIARALAVVGCVLLVAGLLADSLLGLVNHWLTTPAAGSPTPAR